MSFCVVVRVCIRLHGCGELCAWQHKKVLKWCVIPANHFAHAQPLTFIPIIAPFICTTTTTTAHTHTRHYTAYPPTIAAARYIAAQGPKENTVHSYWQMAWENGTKIIIMLTQCVEGGRDKCYQYVDVSLQTSKPTAAVCLTSYVPSVHVSHMATATSDLQPFLIFPFTIHQPHRSEPQVLAQRPCGVDGNLR
jgi:hypothetical protein